MSRDLRDAEITSATDEEVIVETEEGVRYRIYPLADDGPAGFAGSLPPEGSNLRSIKTDHVLYRTLSGEIDSVRAVGGDERAFVEIDRIE